MSSGQLLILLGVAAATLAAVATLRPVGVPTPVVLVLAGLITGFLPFAPDLTLQPHVVLLGLLPLLIFHTAATSSPTAFMRNARTIGVLAVALVIATAAGVAAVAHWLGDLSWPIAFVLGTAVCPTDPAAATGIARRLGLPRRMLAILEGEALFNDVTALVLLAAAVTAATTGHFSVLHTSAAILYSTLAGGAIGLAAGHAGRWTRRRIDDPTVEIAGSIVLAYAAYLPADALHASGVLATAVAGLYVGWHRSTGDVSAGFRLQSAAFWETLTFLIDAVLFVLLGLSARSFTSTAIGPVGGLVLTGTAVVVAVIAIRLTFMMTAGWLIRPIPADSSAANHAGWRERLILGWSGMRGAITLAALLAVPQVSDAGSPLAGRDDTVYVGFAVIVVTLVGQGLTLPTLIRRLKLTEHPAVAETERQARLELTRAALDHLDTVGASSQLDPKLAAGLHAQYLGRMRRLEAISDDENIGEKVRATVASEVTVRRDLNSVQRDRLDELRRRRAIGTTTLRTIERDLDLEEARLAQAGHPGESRKT
ncbi:MAG: Na+/H+ antiporter [Solirubrobacteraceae bacterium]